MPKLKKKINISAVIATISFLYLAFIPLITTPLYNIILGNDFLSIIRILISTIFSLGSIVHFIGCIIFAVGIHTKFDKIAYAAGSTLFWLSVLISLISNILNSVKYNYKLGVGHFISTGFSLFIYLLFIAVGVLFTVFFFIKKPLPKILRFAVFVPAALLGISLIFTFFSNTSNVISSFGHNAGFKWVLYSVLSNSIGTINSLVNLIGFVTAGLKIAEISFKKKSDNTVKISEDVVIENVTTE